LRALRRSALECFARQHFKTPIVDGGLPIGRVLVVREPAAIGG